MRSRWLCSVIVGLTAFVPAAAGAESSVRRARREIVAYVCSRDASKSGLYKIGVHDGARFARVSKDPGYDDKDARWSPDRRRIAWVRGWTFGEGDQGSAGEIFVADADGSDRRRLTDTRLPNLDPDWAPGSSRLVFERGVGTESDIVTIGVEGNGEKRLTRDDGVDIDPVWSPDGRWIAWSSDGAIRKMRADGTGKRKLTGRVDRGRRVEDFAPRWSPNGKRILFVRRLPFGSRSNMELFVIGANGRGMRRLTRTDVSEYEHSWSPDGRKIAFQRRLLDPESTRQHLWVMDAGGRNEVRLTPDLAPRDFSSFFPTWARDSERIAFAWPRGACHRSDIWIARADGSRLRQLTHTDGVGESRPNWYTRGGQEDQV